MSKGVTVYFRDGTSAHFGKANGYKRANDDKELLKVTFETTQAFVNWNSVKYVIMDDDES